MFVRHAWLLTKVVHLILADCPTVGYAPTCALERCYMYLIITASPNKLMHAMYVVHGLYVECDHVDCCVFVKYGVWLYLFWWIATCSEIVCDHDGIKG